jgi:protein gp37
MATNSHIEWTDATWNPVTGCTKISPGCKHCYAERLSKRLKAMGQSNYRNGFELTLQPQMLELPLHWKTPKRIFVNSMSDLFHKDVPTEYIKRVFNVMNRAHWHQFQVLTKRSQRVFELSKELPWAPQIWMGVSVESEQYRVVGGESGPAARPIDSNWVTDIRDQCVKAGVAFFFKQWGGVQKKKTGRTLEGRTWDEMPVQIELTMV